jgi:hypothetical protein
VDYTFLFADVRKVLNVLLHFHNLTKLLERYGQGTSKEFRQLIYILLQSDKDLFELPVGVNLDNL